MKSSQLIEELAYRLLTKELAQYPPLIWEDKCILVLVLERFGYLCGQCYEERKNYFYAYRDFALQQTTPLPKFTSLETRRKAQKYEQQRQKNGYITQEELELANKCIKVGRTFVDEETKDQLLQHKKTLYGLLWMGYKQRYSDLNSPIVKCQPASSEQILKARQMVSAAEQRRRVSDGAKTKRLKPARYVTEYLEVQKIQKACRKLNKPAEEKEHFLSRIFGYFKQLQPIKKGTVERELESALLQKQSFFDDGSLASQVENRESKKKKKHDSL